MSAALRNAYQCLETPAPPSLKEILKAYNQGGDGDRELLIAMLNAKAAEDQRLANTAALHRSVLEYHPSTLPPPSSSSPPEIPMSPTSMSSSSSSSASPRRRCQDPCCASPPPPPPHHYSPYQRSSRVRGSSSRSVRGVSEEGRV